LTCKVPRALPVGIYTEQNPAQGISQVEPTREAMYNTPWEGR